MIALIDYDDAGLVAWAGPGGLIGVLFFVVVLAIAHCNDVDCSKKHCDRGRPELVSHGCLCVEQAR